MFLTYLKNRLLQKLQFRKSEAKPQLSSIYSSLQSKYSKLAKRSYTIIKTWAMIGALFCIFGLCSILLYFLFFYTIMPVSIQESCVQIYKDHSGLVGIASSNIVLEKEKYKIYLKLNLPEDDVNFNIGNFQTSLSFLYKSNKVLELRNMGIMKYYSQTTRVLRAVVRFPLIMMGLAEESQDVMIEYSHAIENPAEISDIKVGIFPSELRINSISIVFQVELNGFRLFVLSHRVLSFLFGTVLIFLSLAGSFLMLVSLNYELSTFDEHKKELLAVEEKVTHKGEKTQEPFDFSLIIQPVEKKAWYKIS